MNVGVIGFGVVGSALAKTLKKKHKIYAFDINKVLNDRQDVYDNAKYLFFCVPTPEHPKGGLDMSIMTEALTHARERCKEKIFVIRSTVSVGYTDRMQGLDKNNAYVFSPEFLREKNAEECTANPELLIAGGNAAPSLAKDIFKPLGQLMEITTTKIAEMVKIASNGILAAQVTASNEIFKSALLEGIDYDNVVKYLHRLKVVGKNLSVPGPDGMCGYGGKCLPKEVSEICEMYRRRGFNSYFFDEVERVNMANRQIPIRRQ